mmetsp:Transcript_104055/g.299655  ORF Transcript_104055/g.299655 Transcript_104055/m.299655 type:complete len:214 (+) Transcript_104055:601-1242(+)
MAQANVWAPGRGGGKGGRGGKGGKGQNTPWGEDEPASDEPVHLKGVPLRLQRQKSDGTVYIKSDDGQFDKQRKSAADIQDPAAGGAGEVTELPDEFKCPLCSLIYKDAVVLHCCMASACDSCITRALRENDYTCPLCKAEDQSPDSLLPNHGLRREVATFLKSTAASFQEDQQKLRDEVTNGRGGKRRGTGAVPIVRSRARLLSRTRPGGVRI